jgi:hypothetical protein
MATYSERSNASGSRGENGIDVETGIGKSSASRGSGRSDIGWWVPLF